jgi:hypothetical protein
MRLKIAFYTLLTILVAITLLYVGALLYKVALLLIATLLLIIGYQISELARRIKDAF